jgi:sulfite exporter TauE/SafE
MCTAPQRVAIHGLDPDHPRIITLRPIADPAPSPTRSTPLSRELVCHAVRIAGYARLGAEGIPWMRPVWSLLNAALLVMGLSLLLLGRQPAWVDELGQQLWRSTGSGQGLSKAGRPLAAGLLWALLPCGLLYSALAMAALASDPLRGGLVMAAFGAGTAANLLGAQAILRAFERRGQAQAQSLQTLGVRLGGAVLAAMAAIALVALALGQPHPFCG